MRLFLALVLPLVLATIAVSAPPARAFTFTAIDGASYDLDDWRGQPVLVVNTASLCGFTPQYADLNALHERYAPEGLVVLAVPSDDFRQELDDDHAVEQYCRVELGVEVPLTRITHVRGPEAHPFYRWLAEEHGVEPSWNFNKVLIGPGGEMLGFWGATTRPTSRRITRAIEAALQE